MPAVVDAGGHVNEFLGDGALPVFGAPNDLAGHADAAVLAAVKIQRLIDERFGGELRIGIGINAGVVIAGGNSESPLDTLSRAFVVLRNDYFVPDRVFIHPSTLGAIRRLKDDIHRHQLDLLQGAGAISGTNEEKPFSACPVRIRRRYSPTVLSVASGAAVVYVRESLTSFYNPYS